MTSWSDIFLFMVLKFKKVHCASNKSKSLKICYFFHIETVSKKKQIYTSKFYLLLLKNGYWLAKQLKNL